MANLLASSTTLAPNAAGISADFTIASGAQATISLSWSQTPPTPKQAEIRIDKKDSAGNYNEWLLVSGMTTPGVIIKAAGTYRVRRTAADVAFLVDQD